MSYLAHIQQQTAWLNRYAKQLDERGYCVLVHYLNSDGGPCNENLYRYFTGGFEPFLRSLRQHPVIVHVYPTSTATSYEQGLRNFQHFYVRFRGVRRLKPIIATLNMYNDDFERRKYNNGDWEYNSRKPEALKLMLQILNIPHHREILTAKTPEYPNAEREAA